jgi:hypothetical protein
MISQPDWRIKPLLSQIADKMWQISDSGGSPSRRVAFRRVRDRAGGTVPPAHLPTCPEMPAARRSLVDSRTSRLVTSSLHGGSQQQDTQTKPFTATWKPSHNGVNGGREAIATPLATEFLRVQICHRRNLWHRMIQARFGHGGLG